MCLVLVLRPRLCGGFEDEDELFPRTVKTGGARTSLNAAPGDDRGRAVGTVVVAKGRSSPGSTGRSPHQPYIRTNQT